MISMIWQLNMIHVLTAILQTPSVLEGLQGPSTDSMALTPLSILASGCNLTTMDLELINYFVGEASKGNENQIG